MPRSQFIISCFSGLTWLFQALPFNSAYSLWLHSLRVRKKSHILIILIRKKLRFVWEGKEQDTLIIQDAYYRMHIRFNFPTRFFFGNHFIVFFAIKSKSHPRRCLSSIFKRLEAYGFVVSYGEENEKTLMKMLCPNGAVDGKIRSTHKLINISSSSATSYLFDMKTLVRALVEA